MPSSIRHIASEASLLVIQPLILPGVAINALHIPTRLADWEALNPFFDLRCRKFVHPAAAACRSTVVCGSDIFETAELSQQLFHIGGSELDVEDRIEEIVRCDPSATEAVSARNRLPGRWQ